MIDVRLDLSPRAALALLAAGCMAALLLSGYALRLHLPSGATVRIGMPRPASAPVAAVPEAQPAPVSPTNAMERFAVDLAAALGNTQPSPEIVAFLVAWQRSEGSSSRFNPLATTQDRPGATIYNSAGVKNYTSYQDGIAATVQTLGYGYTGYGNIVAGIQTNDAALALRGLYASPWGTSAALVEQVYKEQLGTIRNSESIPNSAITGAPLHGPLVVTQGFTGPTHQPTATMGGVDYAATLGQPLYAIIDGTVEVSETWPCGLGVRVRGPVYWTLYCHLSGVTVQSGQHVTAGQQVGQAGMSGQATGPHVHVEVRRDGTIIDPTHMIQEVR
jgi:murein DD-endopeptidase MepM/ murein hydrolase activator NlpD